MVPANRDVEEVVVNLMRERQEAAGQIKSGQKKARGRRSRPRRRKKPTGQASQSNDQSAAKSGKKGDPQS
jgi:hypothetical protein